MNTLIVAALAFFQTQPVEPLDLRWIQGIGAVELSTPGGPILNVTLRDADGMEKTHEIELDLLPLTAQVLEARLSNYVSGRGLAVGLAVTSGDETTYHFLWTHNLSSAPPFARTNELRHGNWSLSKPIFKSTGPRYRVVEVENPEGDSIEITFRRGSIRPGQLDERIFVDSCPLTHEPLQPGRSWLMTVSAPE